VFIIRQIDVDFVSFISSDVIMNKRIEKVPTLKYIVTCIWYNVSIN